MENDSNLIFIRHADVIPFLIAGKSVLHPSDHRNSPPEFTSEARSEFLQSGLDFFQRELAALRHANRRASLTRFVQNVVRPFSVNHKVKRLVNLLGGILFFWRHGPRLVTGQHKSHTKSEAARSPK
jgi:hypothetical protein